MSEYLWNILGNMQEENHNRFIAGVTPSWEIIPGLTLRGRIATDLTAEDIENRNGAKRAIGYTSNAGDLGGYSLKNRKYETYYGDIMLMFDKTFAEKHNVTANVGWSGRQERTTASSLTGLPFSSYSTDTWLFPSGRRYPSVPSLRTFVSCLQSL